MSSVMVWSIRCISGATWCKPCSRTISSKALPRSSSFQAFPGKHYISKCACCKINERMPTGCIGVLLNPVLKDTAAYLSLKCCRVRRIRLQIMAYLCAKCDLLVCMVYLCAEYSVFVCKMWCACVHGLSRICVQNMVYLFGEYGVFVCRIWRIGVKNMAYLYA